MTRDAFWADEGPETEPRDEDERAEALAWFASLERKQFGAAHGGEGDDMATEEQMTGEFPWESQLALLLDGATNLQLKQARYALEREEKKRLEDAQATIRALDPKAPKPRAKRSDAGHARAPKDVPRNGDGVAV